MFFECAGSSEIEKSYLSSSLELISNPQNGHNTGLPVICLSQRGHLSGRGLLNFSSSETPIVFASAKDALH